MSSRITVRRFEQIFLVLYLVMDYLAILGSFLIAFFVRQRADVVTSLDLVEVPSLTFALSDFLRIAPIISLLWLGVMFSTQHYKGIARRRGLSEFFAIFQASSLGVLAMMILGFFIGRQLFSRLITIYAWLISIGLILFGRIVLHQLENFFWEKQIGVRRVLFCGIGRVSSQFLEGIRQLGWPGFYVVGVLNPRAKHEPVTRLQSGPIIRENPDLIAGFPRLGDPEALAKILDKKKVDEVIFGLGKLDNDTLTPLAMECERANVKVSFIPDLLTISSGYKVVETINGVPLMGLTSNAMRGLNASVKRASDILIAGLTMVILSPFLLLLTTLVKLTSAGPVIYRQARIGKNGKVFDTYKFRTMKYESEKHTGRNWTVENDTRRTPIGGFLRRTNLDELPQLWNILRGDMSLVGPRPEQPDYVEQFNRVLPRYEKRHKVRPGLTGWAQANGWRGNTSIEDRLQYDLFYIDNWSLLFDFKIILLTIKSFFNGRGAY